jgi:hypothetical protein
VRVMDRQEKDLTFIRWLKLKDASRYSAIGQKRLIELAKEGAVVGFQEPDTKTHQWIFDRLSLDAYREAQAVEGGAGRAKAKAREIMATVYDRDKDKWSD